MSNVDRYLLHVFAAVEEEVSREVAEGRREAGEPIQLPMLLRVSDLSWSPPEGCQIVGRMGHIVGCLGSLGTVEALQEDPSVLAVEPSRRPSGLDCSRSVPLVKADVVHRKPSSERGDMALVAVIDGDIDVLHKAFLDSTGTRTRILAIWDQSDNTGPHPPTHGYGTEHTEDQINNYLQQGAVPLGLGRVSAGHGTHGTHVTSIAAGRPGGRFAGGVAPEAKIVFIKPQMRVGPTDPFSAGYSTSHVAALEYIENFAQRKGLPVVVNMSQGMNAGAHDGTSLLEVAFDEFSGGGRRPGYIVVKSAGNEREEDIHAKLRMRSNSADSLEWSSHLAHRAPDVVELWFQASDEMRFRLRDPNGATSPWVTWSNNSDNGQFPTGNRYDIDYVRYHRDNGDSRVQAAIRAGSASSIEQGVWALEIQSGKVVSGDIHAWIERDIFPRPIKFTNHVSEEMTLSIPGTARTVIAVASVNTSMPFSVSAFSSYGPTRDGREKPEAAAPGEEIEAAKGDSTSDVVAKSGTSMAAPHLTGAIALLLSYWAKQAPRIQNWDQLNAAQIRAAISQVTQNYNGLWSPGTGFGVLDAEALLRTFG